MHLVKWIRKNNRKIMVFVVIFCMVSFVIGSFGIKLLVGIFGGNNQLIGTYDSKQKIKSPDYIQAQNELSILRMMTADSLLLSQSGGGYAGPLLAHLLFPDSLPASEIASQMKQAIQQRQLKITQSQLDDFFQQKTESPEILWILLKAEAQRAGCTISTTQAENAYHATLANMIASQFEKPDPQQIRQYANQLYAQTMNNVMSKANLTENQLLLIFSDLLEILSYANIVMDNQAVTINQIKASLGRSKEGIDAEFVKIDAKPFVDEDAEVSDEQLQQQFEKYKADAPGNPTEENRFGFGYMLPKRVQLEYMVVLLDDVEKQIEKPTTEALEEYYDQNIDNFRKSEPSDPNNPDSEKIVKTQPYAEVQASIRRTLENEKTTTLANILFNDIKAATETGFESINFDEASAEQLREAAEKGDYVAAGKKLAAKYHVPIETGKTGWLSKDTFSQDKVLNGLAIRRGQQYLRLSDLAFAATKEKETQQRIGLPAIRVWENIGPVNGGFYSMEERKYYPVMALVRVVDIQDAQVPDNIDVTFDTRGVALSQQPSKVTSFSLKEKVKQDILLTRAMETAKNRAEELATMAADTSWDDAIAAYNKKYVKAEDSNDLTPEADTQTIALGTVKDQLRMAPTEVEMARHFMLDNPDRAKSIKGLIVRNMLADQLYAMLPADAESTGIIQKPLVFDPQAACYVIKEVTRKPATIKDYMDNKAQTALQLNAADAGELGLVHFGPENILGRLNYQSKLEQKPGTRQEPLSPDDIDI
jgi:hypothetical protein